MNILIYGQIGSGKSYYAVQQYIIPALKAGRKVYTNISFGFPENLNFLVDYRFSEFLQKDCRGQIIACPFEKLEHYLQLNDLEGKTIRVEKNSLIVIDEAQMIFDYLGTNKVDKRVYAFFAYARHYGLDIVFTTQSVNLVNKFVVDLCNLFLYIEGKKSVSKMMKNHFYIEASARPYSESSLLWKKFTKYDTCIFSLYKSTVDGANDVVVSRRALIPGWSKIAVAGLFLIMSAFWAIKKSTFLFLPP